MVEKEIDIIIPVYNAYKTLERLLHSIAMQTMIDKIRVTLVIDGTQKTYCDQICGFTDVFDMEIINLDVNSGPGVARQVGMENTKCKYIMFADADDTFNNALSIELMYNYAKKYPNACMIQAEHYGICHNPEPYYRLYNSNWTWVFAKMYNREFIEKYHITFPRSRANEDVGFNRTIQLLAITDEEAAVSMEHPVYCWFDNEESITRGNKDFRYKDNVTGYAQNLGFSIESARGKGVKNQTQINELIIDEMATLYVMAMQSFANAPEHRWDIWDAIVVYYNEYFRPLEAIFDSSFIHGRSVTALEGSYQLLEKILPEMTYLQFLSALRSSIT